METVEKVSLAIAMTVTFIFAIFAIAMAADVQTKQRELENRILVLETRVNVYSGSTNTGACDN